MSVFNYIQTFRIDPNTVAGSTEVMLTSVEVYFKGKPQVLRNTTGIENPGLSAWICEVQDDQPIPERILTGSIKSIPYDMIPTSSDSSVATVIGFPTPVIAKTGYTYGIVLKFDDPAFDIWTNVQSHRLVGPTGTTNNPSPGSQGRFGGRCYRSNNSGRAEPFNDRDLKFVVKVAQFVSNNIVIPLVNKDYEFFSIDNTSTGAFSGGEWVYQDVANQTGTLNVSETSLNITGSGTTFTNHTVSDKIVVFSGTNKAVLTIKNIANNTVMTVDKLPPFSNGVSTYKVPPIGTLSFIDYPKNQLYLVDSSANSSVKFVAGTRVVGERSGATANVFSIDKYSVDNFRPTFLVGNPSSSTFTIDYRLANSSNALNSTSDNLALLQFNEPSYDAYILSRSIEVDTSKSGTLYGDRRKSAVANLNILVNVSADKRFSVPYIKKGELDFFTYQNEVNDQYRETRVVGGVSITNYDTEVDKNGLARAKYISKKINFAPDRYAEDIVAYVTAYRPAGTEIRVYAKIHNATDRETFDDKGWTPLELKSNVDKFSTANPNDMYEYTYGFPQYPEVYTSLSGSFITTSASNTIVTSTDQSAVVKSGDLILIRDPLIADNHEVFPVASCNSTAIVLYEQINNANIVGDMKIDKLKYRTTAWNNIANDNVVRYVSTTQVKFDTYSSMQLKVVLLANNSYVVPKVEQIQVIGTSA